MTDQGLKAVIYPELDEAGMQKALNYVNTIVTEFKESAAEDGEDEYDRSIVVIKADILCMRKSHKGILIGEDGKMIKRIGTAARKNIEKMLGCKVYLDLYVKVREDWQNNDAILRETGLSDTEED